MIFFKTSCTVFLCLFLWATPSHADIYAWKDADGITHFSNTTPGDGAKLFLRSKGVRDASAESSVQRHIPPASGESETSGKHLDHQPSATDDTFDNALAALKVSADPLPAEVAEDAIENHRLLSHDLSYGYYDHRFGDEMILKTGFGRHYANQKHRYRYRAVGPFKHRYYRKKYGLHYYPKYLWQYRYYRRYFRGSPIYPYHDDYHRYPYGARPHKDQTAPKKIVRQGSAGARFGAGARLNSIKRPSSTFHNRLTFRGGSIRR